MSVNLIGPNMDLIRNRYDEALALRGMPCKYQYPLMATSNEHGEAVIDSYSEMLDTFVFFDGNPKVKTYRRLGWVVENNADLPFLVHCSFHLPDLQKDSLFHIAGHHTAMPDRIFRVKELTCDLVCPDHMVAQVIPAYDKQTVGRTKTEIAKQYNKSNYFLQNPVDYRGKYMADTEAKD